MRLPLRRSVEGRAAVDAVEAAAAPAAVLVELGFLDDVAAVWVWYERRNTLKESSRGVLWHLCRKKVSRRSH